MTDVTPPSRMVPCTPLPMPGIASSSSCTLRKSCWPASVRTIEFDRRSNSLFPIAASNPASCCDSEGCVTFSSFAARVIDSQCATAQKIRNFLRVTASERVADLISGPVSASSDPTETKVDVRSAV